jgi:hypothetical protein
MKLFRLVKSFTDAFLITGNGRFVMRTLAPSTGCSRLKTGRLRLRTRDASLLPGTRRFVIETALPKTGRARSTVGNQRPRRRTGRLTMKRGALPLRKRRFA